jgi:nucleotide-binding universal stress UspA family protein
MFERVLIAIDEGSGGLDAVRLADLIAAPDAELVLTHVTLGDAAATAPEALERGRRAVGRPCRLRQPVAPLLGPALRETALAEHADLLVLGSDALQATGRVQLAPRLERALHRIPLAVAVAPRGFAQRDGGLERIGVAYAGTPEGRAALAAGRAIAARHDAELHLVTVVAPEHRLPVGTRAGEVEYAEAPEEHVRRVRAAIGAIEDVQAHVAVGAPGEALLRAAADVDLLVAGSRRDPVHTRLVLGDAARALAAQAPCAVLFVPGALGDATR